MKEENVIALKDKYDFKWISKTRRYLGIKVPLKLEDLIKENYDGLYKTGKLKRKSLAVVVAVGKHMQLHLFYLGVQSPLPTPPHWARVKEVMRTSDFI